MRETFTSISILDVDAGIKGFWQKNHMLDVPQQKAKGRLDFQTPLVFNVLPPAMISAVPRDIFCPAVHMQAP